MNRRELIERMDDLLPEVIDFMAEHMTIEAGEPVLRSSSLIFDLMGSGKTEEEKVLWGYWLGILAILLKVEEDSRVVSRMADLLHDEVWRRKNEFKGTE